MLIHKNNEIDGSVSRCLITIHTPYELIFEKIPLSELLAPDDKFVSYNDCT